MFGDVGQGLVFFLLGLILLTGRVAVLKKWRHFGPIFVAIGSSSMVMGVITGEFFSQPGGASVRLPATLPAFSAKKAGT